MLIVLLKNSVFIHVHQKNNVRLLRVTRLELKSVYVGCSVVVIQKVFRHSRKMALLAKS